MYASAQVPHNTGPGGLYAHKMHVWGNKVDEPHLTGDGVLGTSHLGELYTLYRCQYRLCGEG